ncbi:MAG: sensor histidine kinase [Flavisolibacter sp.]
MEIKKRYHFWKVFWVVLAVDILITLIGVLALILAPQEGVTLSHIFQWKNLLREAASLAFGTVYFYYTLNYFYNYFVDKKGYVYFLRVGAIAALACISVTVLSYFWLPDIDTKKQLTTGILLFSVILKTLFFIGLSLLISYLTSLRDGQKQRKILEDQKMQLEVEKSQANFNFLKAQINPHFLHNTLNFLYARSLPYSPELSEGILTLSDIMRYALSEGNAKDGKAPLKDEIEHVRNVIKINQLRFSNNLNVQFDVEGLVNGATIIPFVLITLVENAFKHGDLKNNTYPIVAKVHVKESKLYFYCKNKKKGGPKELSTGIGLDNIKKRLDLAYGKEYAMNIKDETDFYTTELIISKL